MTRRAALKLFLLAMMIVVTPSVSPRADTLVADLSSHLIAITTGFHGDEVLLFGATDGDGDVIVVVRGPDRDLTVRRKDRIAGLWINNDEIRFDDVPSFYHVASSRPIEEFAPPALRSRHEIGVDYLDLQPVTDASDSPAASAVPAAATDGEAAPSAIYDPLAEAREKSFRLALLRNEERAGLYGATMGKVNFLGDRLFRTRVDFPANVPTGTYTIEVFQIFDGKVVGAQTTPLIVSKVGLGAEIYDFAHSNAALYGIFSVILALFAGWLAAVAFRRS